MAHQELAGHTTEHYCTLADSAYLPQVLALHESLLAHDPTAGLWLLCMDDDAYETVARLNPERFVPIRLSEVERRYRHELDGVRATRTHGEYCWTLTPFVVRAVMDSLEDAAIRVTYIDADCMFFSSPQRMLSRFASSGASAMITPHAFGPEYADLAAAGEFCVQFMTFTNTAAGREILHSWGAQCAEWCYARIEDGKFGDQRYLDAWPARYGEAVYVLDDPSLTLAPWNVEHLTNTEGPNGGEFEPCMYHYHGFRWLEPHRVLLNKTYPLAPRTYARFYTPYLEALSRVMRRLVPLGYTVGARRGSLGLGERVSLVIHTLRNERKTARIDY